MDGNDTRPLTRRHRERLKVVAIDGDASPELAVRLGVRGFPTFVGVRCGKVVTRLAGFGGRAALDRFVNEVLSDT